MTFLCGTKQLKAVKNCFLLQEKSMSARVKFGLISIWALRIPFLSFFRASLGLRLFTQDQEQFFCWEEGDCRLQFEETENVHSKAQTQLLSPLG